MLGCKELIHFTVISSILKRKEVFISSDHRCISWNAENLECLSYKNFKGQILTQHTVVSGLSLITWRKIRQ